MQCTKIEDGKESWGPRKDPTKSTASTCTRHSCQRPSQRPRRDSSFSPRDRQTKSGHVFGRNESRCFLRLMLLRVQAGLEAGHKVGNIASTAKKLCVSAPLPLITHGAHFWGLDFHIAFEPGCSAPLCDCLGEGKLGITSLRSDYSCCGWPTCPRLAAVAKQHVYDLLPALLLSAHDIGGDSGKGIAHPLTSIFTAEAWPGGCGQGNDHRYVDHFEAWFDEAFQALLCPLYIASCRRSRSSFTYNKV